MLTIIEGESDIELSGDEEEGGQAVEQAIESLEEDTSADDEGENDDTQRPFWIRSDM